MPGINGDLAAITVYTNTTPVHHTTSNIPLAELDTNVLLLDQKLEGWIESGEVAEGQVGDGTFTTPIAFTNTMNTATPIITVGIADLTGTAPNTIFVTVTNRTAAGFDLTVDGISTTGAWTVNIAWMADGR